MKGKRASHSDNRGEKQGDPHILRWASKVGWDRRVKAVCKPCWELKYCPYGPLVEQFPLQLDRDERACRIFGHDCPVFHVAEPLTETRELRNINRSIPREVQFRVLKRENQICRECGRSVQDEDVEFDHVIPYSKGGSSDESNVRLLCKTCNRKRGANFEAKFLVDSIRDHLIEPAGIELLEWLLQVVAFGRDSAERFGANPKAEDYARQFSRGKVSRIDAAAASSFQNLDELFRGKRPTDLAARLFRALQYRWGHRDRQIHLLIEVADRFDCSVAELIASERDVVRRLGWTVRRDAHVEKKWSKL